MGLGHLHKTDFSVEPVGVSGTEQEEPYATNLGMINRRFDDKCSDTLTSDRIIDKDVAQPPKGGSVGDPPGEGDLAA